MVFGMVVVACIADPFPTPTAPLASASTPSATPVASPAASTSAPSPTAIASLAPTSWVQVFALERGSLGNLITGPEGLIAGGCVRDAESDCGRRILVVSADGDTWEEIEVDTPADIYFGSLRRLGDRLFALGYGHYGPDGGAVVWTSEDGRAWSRVESSSFRGRAVEDIIDSPFGTFAVGHEAPIDSDATSGFLFWPVRGDGSFGTVRVVDNTDGPRLVTGALWAGGEFLAWGYRDGPWRDGPTTLLASQNGKTWTVRAEISAVKRGAVMQIVEAGDRLVAVGYEGRRFPLSPRAWTSKDGGRSWRLSDVPSADAAMYSVSVEGSLLIARGREFSGPKQRVVSWSSTDGRAWTRLPDDEDMPALPGFSALTRATIGDRTCVAGTLFEETPVRAAIYCR
jgi:hypothetical protein